VENRKVLCNFPKNLTTEHAPATRQPALPRSAEIGRAVYASSVSCSRVGLCVAIRG
jgi:hypothetical protein